MTYSYDPVGNISEIRDDAYETVFFDQQEVEPRSLYRYDSLYRLIRASGRENVNAPPNGPTAGKLPDVGGKQFPVTDKTLRNYTQHYEYDSVGNIEKMIHKAGEAGSWTRHYEYANDSNRLLKTTNGNNVTDYQYDTHGSMLNLNNVADEYRLHWDSNDMIQHINLGGGGDAFYRYGSDKERSRKRIVKGNIVEERLYLGGMERYRRWKNGDPEPVEEIETYHVFDGEQRILIVEHVLQTDGDQLDAGVLFKYQYSNHLGSVGLEVDELGRIISYEEYHPYGTTAFSASGEGIRTTRKRYRYTGMERDLESGLSYHSARYYLPWLGRWGSVDPAGLVDGGNLYIYSGNNPVMLIDPSGTEGEKKLMLVPWSNEGTGYGHDVHRSHFLPETRAKELFPGYTKNHSAVYGEMTALLPAWANREADNKIRDYLDENSRKSTKEKIDGVKKIWTEVLGPDHKASIDQWGDASVETMDKINRKHGPKPVVFFRRNGGKRQPIKQRGSASPGLLGSLGMVPLVVEGHGKAVGIGGGQVVGGVAAAKIADKLVAKTAAKTGAKIGAKAPGWAKIVAVPVGAFGGGCGMGGECNPIDALETTGEMIVDDFSNNPVESTFDYLTPTYSVTNWALDKFGWSDTISGTDPDYQRSENERIQLINENLAIRSAQSRGEIPIRTSRSEARVPIASSRGEILIRTSRSKARVPIASGYE